MDVKIGWLIRTERRKGKREPNENSTIFTDFYEPKEGRPASGFSHCFLLDDLMILLKQCNQHADCINTANRLHKLMNDHYRPFVFDSTF